MSGSCTPSNKYRLEYSRLSQSFERVEPRYVDKYARLYIHADIYLVRMLIKYIYVNHVM